MRTPLSSAAIVIITFAGSFMGGSRAMGQPAVPSDLGVVPRYGAVIDLSLTWQDNSGNEDGFRIERREQGAAAFNLLTTVGQNVTSFIDTSATPDKYWEYQVCATSASLGNSAFTDVSHATSPKQVWPIDDGDHDILHSFGTPLNFSGFRYFHEGVDISASGKRVNAGRGGRVTRTAPSTSNGGQMWLDVDFGAGPEQDTYAHTVVDTTWGSGDVIAPGDKIGTVNTAWFNRAVEADHVHWGDGHMNNLRPYQSDGDRDPNTTAPVVADINNDSQDFIVVNAAANDHNNPRSPAWGDVDFLVDAYDDQAPNMNLMVAPYRLGYWIQAGIPGGEDVRSAVTPYRLIEFNYTLTGPSAPGPVENAVVYWNLNANLQGINTWQSCLTWIITNTKGTDGTTGNVDANQFWRTDARKGTGTEPNGSDAQRARENQEARFPDGTYYAHILVEDLVNRTDAVRSVLVDNSRPYVRKVTVYSGAQIVYQAQWVWDAVTAQLAIQPADFNSAAAFSALRTHDVTIEVEFSEPMKTAAITSITPLGHAPTLASTQSTDARTVWKGIISNLDIADDGSDDGIHMMTISGTDLTGNALLQIQNRNNMGADHHNRDAGGSLRGTAGSDTIHGFRIGPPVGVIPITAIFMKQQAADPTSPTIADRSAQLQQALNTYFSEVSYSAVSFSVSGQGWYQLNSPLSWYYTLPQTPLVDLVQEAITTAQLNGVNLSTVRYVLIVTDETSARDEWSTTGGWPYQVTGASGGQLIAAGTLNLASPNPRISNLAGRWIGLIDLFAYPEVTVARPFVGPWSHMSDKDHEPHVMGWEKWRAGWLDETGTATKKTLTRVPKPSVSSPIQNKTYTLLPIDKSDDGTKMVAIETADRLHYTVEYRRTQGLDAALPDTGVLIVKTNDAVNQGEGPAIVQESSVTAGNLSDATFNLTSPRDVFDDTGSGVKIEVTALTIDQAQIRLNYKLPPKENDVYVAPHDDRWQTEDIWVDAPDLTGQFAADPLTVKDANEKPVVGKLNKVIARVRNKGHADATNFEIHMEIREPWGAGGPWRSLKVETVPLLQGQDSNPNAYHLVVGDWTPSGDVHSCVQATLRGVANDINADNNWTQENISEFVTSSGSPYGPVTSRFEVENPYTETVPVFFKVDGLPSGWTYLLNPERLVIPPKGVGKAQVTIQPQDEAPLCSKEQITVSAFTPRVDTLKRLGAITLQVALKSTNGLTATSWVDCGADDKKVTTARANKDAAGRCLIYVQGCTDPKLANTKVAVVYTAPDGSSQVHYVTTDANGCYLDMVPAGTPGLWQTQVVLEETDCRAEAKTPDQTVLVPLPAGSFCGGSLWCCWLWLAFLVSLIATLVWLTRWMSGQGTARWRFFVALIVTAVLGWLLLTRCSINLCLLLLSLAVAILIALVIICRFRILPARRQ